MEKPTKRKKQGGTKKTRGMRAVDHMLGKEEGRGEVRKADIYADFVEWFVLDKDERKELGEPLTEQAFAKLHGINQKTLVDWKKRVEFVGLQAIALQKKVARDASQVIGALKRRCLKYGMGSDVELFLTYGGWDKKRVVELKPPMEFGANDIRALTAKLPPEKQKKYLDTLAALIADAVNADDDISF